MIFDFFGRTSNSHYTCIQRPVTLTNVLKVIEDQIAVDYINFSSTGKFPHRYSIQNHPSVSDVVDYEKVKGRSGKMLLLYSKVSDTDTLQFTYAESKRSFYKQLPIVSTVIKSVIIKWSTYFIAGLVNHLYNLLCIRVAVKVLGFPYCWTFFVIAEPTCP